MSGRAVLLLFLSIAGCSRPAPTGGVAVDDTGVPLRLAHAPKRIVSLAPNVTELLFLLGAGPQIVGVTGFCNHPSEARRKPRVGGMVNPDAERIAALKPDLAVASFDGNPAAVRRMMQVLRVPLYAVRVDTLSNLYRTVAVLGNIMKKKAAAVRLQRSIRRQVAQLHGRWQSRRVFVQIGTEPPLFTFGQGTLLDQLLEQSGAINIGRLGTGRYPALPAESVAGARPGLILVLGRSNARSMAYWRRVAPRSRVRFVAADPLSRPGPRMIASFVRLVCADEK